MKRSAHLHSGNPAELNLPTSFVDFFATVLLVVMVNHPAFDVRREKLPELVPEPAGGTAPADGRSGYRIELNADGTATFDGAAVPVLELARRVAAEPHGDWPIQVTLETMPDGRGAMQGWIQLQADLSQAKLWSRVQVLTRSANVGATRGGAQP